MPEAPPNLDPSIHAPVRLAVMSLLLAHEEAEFTYLREMTGATDGNLAAHLGRLEKTGYIKVRKRFFKRKPQTLYGMTEKGRKAFELYLTQLEALLPPKKKR